MLELKLTRQRLFWFGIWLYTVLSNVSDALPFGQLWIFADIFLILATVLWKRNWKYPLTITSFNIYTIVFVAYCFLTMLWAQKPGLVVNKSIGVLVNCIALYVICLEYKELLDVERLLKTIMFGFYASVLVAFAVYGPGTVINLILKGSRLVTKELAIDRNAIGMTSAYAMLINAYFIFQTRRLRLSDLLAVPAMVMILASGSRKALILIALGIMGMLLLKSWNKRDRINSVLKIVIVVLLLVLGFLVLLQLPMFSNMLDRFMDIITALNGTDYTRSNTTYLRFEYMGLGWKLFSQNPILGIGLHNASIHTKELYGINHYLHNNYLELLACTGLVGFLIYYSIYFYFIRNFWLQRKKRDPLYDICLVLMVLLLVMDFASVSYYSKNRFLFLLLLWLEVQRLRRTPDIKSGSPSPEPLK